jgi:hypothetical protein
MVTGVEGIAFDALGRLWTVSEAGSLRWSHAYPVLFSIDPAPLRQAAERDACSIMLAN